MQEYELVQRILAGDESAFKVVYNDNYRKVLNACYRFVNNREQAEDLAQEVFIEVFRSLKNFRSEAKLSTWIYRIAVTRSIDQLRAQKRKKRFAFLKSLTEEDNMIEQIPARDYEDPGFNLENEERIKVLNWALGSLSGNQRVAFTLSKYDEMSYKEIAEILETSISSVESLIHRAKKNLEKKLYNYYKKHL
jgi:RNA polymerase sigma-70 factor, ECF subfamily